MNERLAQLEIQMSDQTLSDEQYAALDREWQKEFDRGGPVGTPSHKFECRGCGHLRCGQCGDSMDYHEDVQLLPCAPGWSVFVAIKDGTDATFPIVGWSLTRGGQILPAFVAYSPDCRFGEEVASQVWTSWSFGTAVAVEYIVILPPKDAASD